MFSLHCTLQKAKKQKSVTEDSDQGGPSTPVTSPKKDEGAQSGNQANVPSTPGKDKSGNQPPTSKDKSPSNGVSVQNRQSDVAMDKSNNNTTQLVIDNKAGAMATTAPQVYQISGATIIGGATVAVAGQPQLQGPVAITSSVTTVTTVPVAITTNGTAILSVQQGKVDDKNKKKDKSDKNKSKTVLQARPIVPAPMTVTSSLAPVTTHATMATGTAGLKPIQPKPTILGEPSRTDPALIQLKESKKSKKKKNKDKEQSPPHQAKPGATTTSGNKDGAKPEVTTAHVRPQVLTPGGQPQQQQQQQQQQPPQVHVVKAESTSVIKSASSSPLKAPGAGEGIDLRTNAPTTQPVAPKPPTDLSTKRPQDLSNKPGGSPSHGGGHKHLHPHHHSPGKSRSVLSPLNVSTDGKEHGGEARSPAAYSDISDDGAPAALDADGHPKQHKDAQKPEGGKAGERAPETQGGSAPTDAYSVYSGGQYYNNPSYLVPGGVPAGSPGQQGSGGSRQSTPGPKDPKDGEPHPRPAGDGKTPMKDAPSNPSSRESRPSSRDPRDPSSERPPSDHRPPSQQGGGAPPTGADRELQKALHQQQIAYQQYQQYIAAYGYNIDPSYHHHLMTHDPAYRYSML